MIIYWFKRNLFFSLLSICFLIKSTHQVRFVKFYWNRIEIQNGMVVQIELNHLKVNYPEFTKYVINQTIANEREKSDQSSTTYKQRTKATITSSSVPESTTSGNFLYYNNATNSIEGVSMQATYSVIRLTPAKNLTIITSSINPLVPSVKLKSSQHNKEEKSESSNSNNNHTSKKMFKNKSILPLYHQFVYTIRISNDVRLNSNSNSKDLVDLLNDQSIDSSRIRVELLKQISKQLDLAVDELKINWIEKQNNRNRKTNEHNEYDYADYDDMEYYYSYEEPEFISDDRINETSSKPPKFTNILISLSNIHLLQLQNSYFSLKSIKSSKNLTLKYKIDCERFFKNIVEKHSDATSFELHLLDMAKRFVVTKRNVADGEAELSKLESLRKVQFLKLCDLSKINEILNSNDKLLNNSYMKNATQEIHFPHNLVKDDLDYSFYSTTYEDIITIDESTNSKANKTQKITNNNKLDSNKIVNFKSEINSNETLADSNANTTSASTAWTSFLNFFSISSLKKVFWSIVPQEDFVLAVAVPLITVISFCVFSIVVVCLLQMFNKKNMKQLKNSSADMFLSRDTTESTFGINTSASHNSSAQHNNSTKHNPLSINYHTKSDPIVKQRAYLSKGVPVILYEEMSDRPIDDYDENHREVVEHGTHSGSNTISYRSPLILRHEKPPLPAPPEYCRQSFNFKSDNILNELQIMLQNDINYLSDSFNEEKALLMNRSSQIDIKSSPSPSPLSSSSTKPNVNLYKDHQLAEKSTGRQQALRNSTERNVYVKPLLNSIKEQNLNEMLP